MKLYNFLYDVNLFKISKHFVYDDETDSPYFLYKSKSFYGATIRTVEGIENYDGDQLIMAIRYKGHGFSNGEFDRLTGVKMDLMTLDDDRVSEAGIYNGLITINEVPNASLLMSLHDEKENRTGIITITKETNYNG